MLIQTKVIKARSALLSNFEVLRRLKEQEAEQQVHARAALVKREDDEAEHQTNTIEALGAIVSENMRTIQFEVCPSTFNDLIKALRECIGYPVSVDVPFINS